MSNNVVFEDYSIQCKKAIKEKSLIFLEEAGSEVESLTVRNQVRKTGQTAGSWNHVVDAGGQAVHIGSNFENAIWEEFGTGEFAEKGDGRKGWWVYVEGSSSGSGKGGKSYSSKAEAKRAMAILRKKGLKAYYTKGKQARHPFMSAYNSSKSKIIRMAEVLFGGLSS